MALAVRELGPFFPRADLATSLSVPPPPMEEYVPVAGDVWIVAVVRAAGVDVVGPGGWTREHTVTGVVEESGDVGVVTYWHRVLGHGEGALPVVFSLALPVWARAMLRAYRPDGRGVVDEERASFLGRQWAAELGA